MIHNSLVVMHIIVAYYTFCKTLNIAPVQLVLRFKSVHGIEIRFKLCRIRVL